jgi:hypothetical protein
MKKTRYNFTPFYFMISDINGESITISATDVSVKTVTRSIIIPLKSNKINSLKQAKTISGTSRGSVVEILSYNSKKDSYKVRFEVANGESDSDYSDVISAKELLANKLLVKYNYNLNTLINKNK